MDIQKFKELIEEANDKFSNLNQDLQQKVETIDKFQKYLVGSLALNISLLLIVAYVWTNTVVTEEELFGKARESITNEIIEKGNKIKNYTEGILEENKKINNSLNKRIDQIEDGYDSDYKELLDGLDDYVTEINLSSKLQDISSENSLKISKVEIKTEKNINDINSKIKEVENISKNIDNFVSNDHLDKILDDIGARINGVKEDFGSKDILLKDKLDNEIKGIQEKINSSNLTIFEKNEIKKDIKRIKGENTDISTENSQIKKSISELERALQALQDKVNLLHP
tara:strand:- start:4468 stop:5319 length:852 start_codon:yes stop_codon:yes gene_type:complete